MIVYTPASFETPVYATVVASLVAVTVAPGTAPPWESDTMPVTVPRPTCARAADVDAANRHSATTSRTPALVMIAVIWFLRVTKR